MWLALPILRWNRRYAGNIVCFFLSRNQPLQQEKRLNPNIRYYSTDESSSKTTKSFYEILDVSENATQEEIKSAYYSLSKAFHPDINKNSEDAAVRFQEISDAYEILGNYYLRKKYDKGLLPTGKLPPSSERGFTGPPIEHAKFYESRLTRRTASSVGKATTTHNFDSWSQAHYSKTIQSQTVAKKSRLDKKEYEDKHRFSGKIDFLLLLFTFIGLLLSVSVFKKISKKAGVSSET